MPQIDLRDGIPQFSAQIVGSPSKGGLKFCGSFTDCPHNAPSWLPFALLAGFVLLVFLLSRLPKTKGKYRRVARGPKPINQFEDPPPDAPRGPKRDE